MLYAYSDTGEKVRATPSRTAICPECGGKVIAKCGSINIWHWAHRSFVACDPWCEGETEWHLYWKSLFPKEYVEVPVVVSGVRHRADVKTPNGIIIEFQHSSLSVLDIRAREMFYQNMIWVFDVRVPYVDDRLLLRDKGSYTTFRWMHPRKSLAYTRCQSFWDIGSNKLFEIKKMYLDEYFGGWGTFITKENFLARIYSDLYIPPK
jgi:competence protein CoiA